MAAGRIKLESGDHIGSRYSGRSAVAMTLPDYPIPATIGLFLCDWLATIHGNDLRSLVPNLPADGQPRLAIQSSLSGAEHFRWRTAGGRGLPAGQFFIPVLCVLVSQPVELGQPGVGRVALVDAQLLAVVALARDEGPAPGKAVRSNEYIALRLCPHRDRPRLAALGPGRLE
jgi:hypothetical protein